MPRPSPFSQLEKFSIKSLVGSGDAPVEFVAQYNPESLAVRYQRHLGTTRLARGGEVPDWGGRELTKLSVTLVLDGTGVDPRVGRARLSVAERVKAFMECCVGAGDPQREHPLLQVHWSKQIAWGGRPGSELFLCRLVSANIHYASFGRDGSPLHAELQVEFAEEPRLATGNASSAVGEVKVKAPREGDSLPAMCEKEYGSSDSYILLAEENGLDNFRQIEPGTPLRFPAALGGGGAGRVG